jgi:malate dehydrogenase (oxaloacetate-decarboxylating)(NADP+)
LLVDGEMQASVMRLIKELMKENYPFSELVDKDVNALIFPNLASGNIALQPAKGIRCGRCYRADIVGLKKPVHIFTIRKFGSQHCEYCSDRMC